MNLQQTTEIILKWITSCETQEQLDLIDEIVDTFIAARFLDVEKSEKIFAIVTITTAIQSQSKLVTLNLNPLTPKSCQQTSLSSLPS